MDDLLEDVARAGIPVQIGFQRRFDAGYRAAHEAVAGGTVGRILVMRAATHDPSPPSEDYIAGSGGIFRDLHIHDFEDLMQETYARAFRSWRSFQPGTNLAQGLRDWRRRIDHVHVKDVRLDVPSGFADWDEAWRRGIFYELGAGDVDLDAFFAELDGYSGWLVVEQDWVPGAGDDVVDRAEAQVRNRRWLAEHAGL